MKMTNDEYKEFSDRHMQRSPLGGDMSKAFSVGGLICCIGQLLTDMYTALGADGTEAASLCSVTLVFLGAVLTGLGVYDRIAKFAGGGSLVPITGFANSVAAPALEFKTEGLVTGTAAKMFIIAGPVIVYGTAASTVYGLILLVLGG